MFNFDIPSLRQRSVMQDWGSVPDSTGYDWSAPMVDYSAGEMPASNVGMNMPPPSVGPVQDTPFPGMFGREYTPSLTGAQPTGPTQGAPPAQVAPPQVNTYDPESSSRRTMDVVNKMFTPDFTDRDRLRGLMDAAPERQAPGWGRGLSAIALGIGSKSPEEGLKAQEAVMFAPHRRAMADWTAKADPFYKTAELENRQNVNERTLTTNVVSAETQARRIEENARQADLKNEVAQEKNRIARLRAEIAGSPDYEVSARGPTIIVTNKKTGVPTDTGIKTGWMSEADKIEAEGKWGVKRSEASGAAAIARTQAAGTGILQDPETGERWERVPGGGLRRIEGGPEGPLTKPGTPRASADEDTPGEVKTGRQNTIQGIMDEDSTAREFFTGKPGSYEQIPRPKPPRFWGDNSVKIKKWDEIAKRINPNYKPPPDPHTPPPTEATPAPPAASAKPFPEVRVNPSTNKGLGPPTAKPFGSPTVIESRGAPASTYTYKRNNIDPNIIRRTSSDGKIEEVSIDGGKTWTRRK